MDSCSEPLSSIVIGPRTRPVTLNGSPVPSNGTCSPLTRVLSAEPLVPSVAVPLLVTLRVPAPVTSRSSSAGW